MIRSRRNPRIVELVRLHRARHRRRTGKTLIEGPHLLADALSTGQEVTEVLCLPTDEPTRTLCARRGIPLTMCTEEVLSKVADTANPRGPVAVLTIPQNTPQHRDILWVLVSDPGNCGTLIRTASAFGWDVMMGDHSVDPWAPKVLRSGAGGHFGVVIGEAPKAPPGVWVVAAVAHGGVPLHRLDEELDQERQWWLAIGSESGGLPSSITDRADVRCSIPMRGSAESLNAAAAGAIICHHLGRLRATGVKETEGLPKLK